MGIGKTRRQGVYARLKTGYGARFASTRPTVRASAQGAAVDALADPHGR